MDSTQFMGLFIAAIIALLGAAGVVTTIIIKPIIGLNRTMVKLDDSITALNKTANAMENRLDKHDIEIDKLNDNDKNFEGRISRLEAQKR